ncbi:acetyltransferase [Melanomma pulvis-pyrius CBS 109.77]|uniref:Acetyltransferase n=1 Tax=Melanomma pulvis-pyrius CBS 109.77 TaxID=1314802 RepID=A0A6A6X7E7_9PLEO|nr:acetyltransferase [Melanomma pulvis-pyrius CBS 109.77]
MADSKVVVYEAEFPRDTQLVSTLFTAYAKSLPIDLSFQNFDVELSSLPGKYAYSMGGTIFLSHKSSPEAGAEATVLQDPEIIGCAALRAFDTPRSCELKRLYITPESRRLGAGRKLFESAIAKAKTMGYAEMLLDTLPTMTAARKMYEKYGFEECEKYYDSPIEGTVFMKLKLK